MKSRVWFTMLRASAYRYPTHSKTALDLLPFSKSHFRVAFLFCTPLTDKRAKFPTNPDAPNQPQTVWKPLLGLFFAHPDTPDEIDLFSAQARRGLDCARKGLGGGADFGGCGGVGAMHHRRIRWAQALPARGCGVRRWAQSCNALQAAL